jgi:hypothetical protein
MALTMHDAVFSCELKNCYVFRNSLFFESVYGDVYYVKIMKFEIQFQKIEGVSALDYLTTT